MPDPNVFDPEKPPELAVTRWFNTPVPLTLAALKGRVVALFAFQMLCPGCVSHALPQARRLAELVRDDEVAVLGLHSVFEHHAANSPETLEAFIHEYRWPFPIGIDRPDGTNPPLTMQAYEMRGTPSLLLFDRQGRLRRHYLGQVDDLRLGAELMGLAIEDRDAPREASVVVERKLHATLVDPSGHHGHGQDHAHGEGCGHDHGHGHGEACGHDHGHHDHGHPDHDHGPGPGAGPGAKHG